MLYDQTDLECAFLSSSLYEYRAIRYVDYIQANRGGGLRDENWVLILIDANNRPTVVSEINPGDFDLLIEWIDRSPIRTDYRRIENGENVLPSEMYLDLLRRNKILFSR